MTAANLIIIGAGDLAREVYFCALEPHPDASSTFNPLGFIVEPGFEQKPGSTVEGLPVFSFEEAVEVQQRESALVVCGIGIPRARADTTARARRLMPDAGFATVIHKSAVIMPNTTLAEGVYVGCHVSIATGCRLEAHSVVNFNASIGHDSVLGPFSVVSPGCLISGRTEIGARSFLGSGAITYPRSRIGDDCTVSAQGVVARKLDDGCRLIAKPNAMILPPDDAP